MNTIIFGDGNLGRAIATALREAGTEPLLLGRPDSGRHAPAAIRGAETVFEASRGDAFSIPLRKIVDALSGILWSRKLHPTATIASLGAG